MANTAYKGFETSGALLRAYAELALAHRNNKDREEGFAGITGKPIKPYVDLGLTVALLVLNAAILEGTLRALITEDVAEEIEQEMQEGKAQGRTEPERFERFLAKFQTEIETQGGWDRLKEQIGVYYDESLDSLMKKKDEGLLEAINSLFVLRNVFAHGTALIQPTVKMDETMKSLYPYNWQGKLQRATVYLKASFKGADVFECIADHDVPAHFFSRTVEFLTIAAETFEPVPTRATELISKLQKYSFGYRL